ncbi:MAG: outer membrane beta-barrel domain-containing protein, partial [Paraglaciecola sp.]
MEVRFRSLFLVVLALLNSSSLMAQEPVKAGTLIEPKVTRQDINEANIDSENFELGLLVGVISIEDFSSSPLFGLRAAYHIN